VLPTYNEKDNLPELVAGIFEALPLASILIVDDGSPDGTGDWVAQESQKEPRLHLLQRGLKQGLGSAYRAGWNWGLTGNHNPIVTMDADGSHHPRHLPALLALVEEGSIGLGIGSRYVPGGGVRNWPLHRRLLSKIANHLSRLLLRLPANDATAGYRAYRAEALHAIGPDSVKAEGYSFLEESLWRIHKAGFQVAETAILFEERRQGSSKINRSEILKAAVTLLRLRFTPTPTSKAP
jgi:dolichol-phosphate mannosyltransferase